MSSANFTVKLEPWEESIEEDQQRAQHRALGDACVESEGQWYSAALPHHLESAWQEDQDPPADGGVQTQVSELVDEPGGSDAV